MDRNSSSRLFAKSRYGHEDQLPIGSGWIHSGPGLTPAPLLKRECRRAGLLQHKAARLLRKLPDRAQGTDYFAGGCASYRTECRGREPSGCHDGAEARNGQ